MPRIRTIKPEFWSDEKLVELEFVDRLFFIGLWNFADDQGYLDYRPKRIKMQVFPGDNYDVIKGLRTLHEASLVSLYQGPEGLVVYITNWSKHQKVSNPARERFSPSDLHICPSFDRAVQRSLEPYPAEGKGREGKGIESEAADAESDPPREDVERLCTLLADLIEKNGSKRPPITQRWRDSARLLLDRDGRTEEQVTNCIHWCQADEFWHKNVLSMPKLREKYDQLRLHAKEGRRGQVLPFTQQQRTRQPGDGEESWMRRTSPGGES